MPAPTCPKYVCEVSAVDATLLCCVCSDVSKEHTALIFKVAAVYSGKKFTHRKIPFGKAPCVIESGACAHARAHTHTEGENKLKEGRRSERNLYNKDVCSL